MIHISRVDLTERGILLPHDRVGMVIAQPYLTLTEQEPFRTVVGGKAQLLANLGATLRAHIAVTSNARGNNAISSGNGRFSEPDNRLHESKVGYGRPPVHTRFKPDQSGNPSGRPKGAQNLKTLFDQILREEISLREGEVTKKITKAEAILRGLVVGAMKGDSRSQMTLFRLAEATGQFEEAPAPLQVIQRIIVNPGAVLSEQVPADSTEVP